jgi:hypothetical protein
MNRSIRNTIDPVHHTYPVVIPNRTGRRRQCRPGTPPTRPPPNIMIPDPLYTFDAVVDGIEVVHDFRVYNRGTGELTIEKVQTG